MSKETSRIHQMCRHWVPVGGNSAPLFILSVLRSKIAVWTYCNLVTFSTSSEFR